MTRTISPAPIRKALTVPIAPAAAFDLFLGRMESWWLPGHSLLQAPIDRIVIEPRVGGRWLERGTDGSEYQWGVVLVWDPPTKAVLAWQLSAEWAFDPSLVTEVEVTFSDSAEGTRVTFEHRLLERFGATADEQREGMDRGWGALLQSYGDHAIGAKSQ